MTGVATPGKTADDEKVKPTPALYDHIKRTYNAMLREAESRPADDGLSMVVWEGHLTHLIMHQLNLSSPYYTKVTRALRAMGCIRQLRRGGSTGQSLWELIKEPEEASLIALLVPDADGNTGISGNQKGQAAGSNATILQQIQQQITDMNTRLLVIEKAFENLIEEETSDD